MTVEAKALKVIKMQKELEDINQKHRNMSIEMRKLKEEVLKDEDENKALKTVMLQIQLDKFVETAKKLQPGLVKLTKEIENEAKQKE